MHSGCADAIPAPLTKRRGQLYEYTLSNGYYTGYGDFVTAIRMLSTLENSSYSNSGMWGYMHPVLNQELWWWDQYSPNFATELNW